jgi:hypothetical protein
LDEAVQKTTLGSALENAGRVSHFHTARLLLDFSFAAV